MTNSDCYTIANGMRVAANEYDKCAEISEAGGLPMLAEQFQEQAKEARRIADEMEEEALSE